MIQQTANRLNASVAANTIAISDETLPFTVRIARTEEDVRKAVQIRQSAYARHVPDFAKTLVNPEPADFDDGVAILLAESKLDGAALGTMRIQTNRYQPLGLEGSIALPESLANCRLAEATRLGVTDERVGRLVKTALFKAFFNYCEQHGIDHMVITARNPLDRMYERMLFNDVYPDLGYVPLKHVGNMPHRIMAFEVATAYDRWASVGHPLLNFMCHTNHADINVKSAPARLIQTVGKLEFSSPSAAISL